MVDDSLEFRTASSCQFGNCVKVARRAADGAVFLGDTKVAGIALIEFTGTDWAGFVGRIKKGDLDLDRLGGAH